MNRRQLLQLGALALAARPLSATAPRVQGRRRCRELGVRIGRLRPGRWNAITDVPGVSVGHATLVAGSGRLEVGKGPVRTGVTAIRPHPEISRLCLPCGFDVANGNGEVTGLGQLASLGILGSPICLTNTSSVGMVYDALLAELPRDRLPASEPVVGETWDAFLNDIEGRHVHRRHVVEALRAAATGPVAEGCVGGGTGMICYGFKGGIGTASRGLSGPLGSYTVGALVQANHGERALLRIDGVPVGAEIPDLLPEPAPTPGPSSILMVLATDAPLLDYQLDRLARRATHGLARTGSISGNSSGDFTIAFSTANAVPREAFWRGDSYELRSIEQFGIDPLFEAAAEATEEAIVNALFMATDMEGRDGQRVHALPLDRTLAIMKRRGRLFPEAAEEGAGA